MSKTTTSPILWLPSAADGISLTPSASSWTNASWHEVSSSAPTDLYPAYLAVLPNNGATLAEVSAEIDIGTGTAGNELALITVRARYAPDQWGPLGTIPLGVIYNRIASGTRVSARVRHGATADTDVYRIALGYYATLGGATGYSTGSPSMTPSGSSSATITSGSSWVYGSWVEILPAASVTTALLVTGIVASSITSPHEIQIGLGASSSEVVRYTMAYGSQTGSGNGVHYVRLARPLYVPQSTRIAMRTRSGTGSAAFFGTLWHVRA